MSDLQPPPTYRDPVRVDERTGRARFDEVWLKWFIDLIATLNAAGGTTIQHNDTSGLQGGTTSQYYHLTSTEHGAITGTKTANTFFAGPSSGGAAVAAFRALVTADLPAGTGTVTSVALTATPSGIFDVSGSPVTAAGTLALSLDNQAANIVLAGPTSGAAATPGFRSLVLADMPSTIYSNLYAAVHG